MSEKGEGKKRESKKKETKRKSTLGSVRPKVSVEINVPVILKDNTKLDDAQITKMVELKIFTSNKELIYNAINYINIVGYQASYQFFLDNKDDPELYWKLPTFTDEKKSADKEKENMKTERKAISGVGKCFKCGATTLSFSTAQTRSGDEGETVTFVCSQCGNKWKL